MNEFAHIVDKLEPLLLAIFVPVALLGWTYGFLAKVGTRQRLMAWEPVDKDARFVLGIGVFGSILIGIFLVSSYVNRSALEEINAELSMKVGTVSVNGQPFQKSGALVDALRRMSNTGAHHSSPGQTFNVILTTEKGPVTLVLRRDSQNPREYWVFYDSFQSTQSSDVARVFTDVLDMQ